ncbi:MAG: T9SS type A sorting domain-containing protein [Bacteroidales bacterium]|nr:T9SS type A sorting domain-containing protein [Bacteroidales bacterium]
MKEFFFLIVLNFFVYTLIAQPSSFTWYNKHLDRINPISPAKNQRENGPCTVFASIAAVEAMSAIYYNFNGNSLILSESSVYNAGAESGCLGISCNGGADVPTVLDFIIETGVVDNQSYPYPDTGTICRNDCQEVFNAGHYNSLVTIPDWEQLTTITGTEAQKDTALKQAIMDYGPIIVTLGGYYNNGYVTKDLYPGTAYNTSHTILILGWRNNPGLEWHIKDSWHEKHSIYYRLKDSINIFNYSPTFYRIIPKIGNDSISCQGNECSQLYGNRYYEDWDQDGFYNWGLDTYPKPENCPGIDKMDIDDGDPNTIFRDGYDPLPAPYIYDTISKYVCPGGRIFTLNNFDNLSNLGFSVSWTVSPSGYFSSSPSGNNDTATVTPIASYLGKQCKIEFNLSYNSTLVKTYKFEFIINGPREDLVSMSVLDSYGGSPPGSGDMYYLCPNTTYNIFYYNYDNNCQTSNFVWDLPYGWTEHWDYGHVLSINTNDYPYGLLDVKANHCCADNQVRVYSLYFAEADCGEYFMAYPNPSSEFVDIDVVKDKISSEELVSDIKTYLSIVDKSGTTRFSTTFKGFPHRINTSDLPDGIYFMNIQFKDKRSSIRLVIKH